MGDVMLSPSQLPSSDSLDGLAVATPDSGSDATTLVCSLGCGGVRCAPHCAQRFATARGYFCALLALFLLLGAVRGYFAALAYLIADLYGIPDVAIYVLLAVGETVQGVSSLFVAHGGARAHRPSWLGAPAFLHAGACFAALVPFVTHSRAHWLPPVRNGTNEYLCETVATTSATSGVETCWTTLTVLIIVQVTAGVAWAALLTHGVAYLDDNVSNDDSPALLGALLGADRVGPTLGQSLAFLCSSGTGDVTAGGDINKIWWLGWPVLGALLLATALIAAMFPKRLPSAAVRERANIILDVVCRRVRIDDQPTDIDLPHGLRATMRRLLRNRVVIFITLFLMFVYAPLHFFTQYENRYLESVFFIPEPEYSGGVFKDQWTSRVTTGFIKPPFILMAMLLSGLIIARKQPRASAVAMWNVIIVLAAAVIFFIFIGLRCPVQLNGMNDGNLQIDAFCNSDCSCQSNIPFLPVCGRNGGITYYSPCHAGCTQVEHIDDIKLYNNCKCLKYEKRAKGGACSNSDCTSKYVIFQSLAVLTSGLVGTCLVGSILLCLRSVVAQDKMHALAFVIMHVGATHLPGKYLYKVITDATCVYWGGDYHCQLFNGSSLALWFNLLTGTLFLFAALFGLLAWRHSKTVNLFKDNPEDPDALEMNEIRQKLNARLATPYTRRKRRNKYGNNSSEGEESEGHDESDGIANEEIQNDTSETQPLQQRTNNATLEHNERNDESGVNEVKQRENQNQDSENETLDSENDVFEQDRNNGSNKNNKLWRATLV